MQPELKVIRSESDGSDYLIIYLKILLLAIQAESPGFLRFTTDLPYNARMLASVIEEDQSTVESAISRFEALGLLEPLDDGTLFLTKAPYMVGSETHAAIRKRIQRAKNGELEGVGQCPKIVPQSQSIKIEKDEEKKDSSRDGESLVSRSSAQTDKVEEILSNLPWKKGR